MKVSLLVLATPFLLAAKEPGKLLFDDDFERDTLEKEDNGWEIQGVEKDRAEKFVKIKKGVLHVSNPTDPETEIRLHREIDFWNGRIDLRFKLENETDNLGINLADPSFKGSHEGHLCIARIRPTLVVISDLKTGVMDRRIRDLRLKNDISPTLLKLLQKKTAKFPQQLALKTWHTLSVQVVGNTMAVTINGKEVGRLSSVGMTHRNKRMLRLSIPRSAQLDDLRIYSL